MVDSGTLVYAAGVVTFIVAAGYGVKYALGDSPPVIVTDDMVVALQQVVDVSDNSARRLIEQAGGDVDRAAETALRGRTHLQGLTETLEARHAQRNSRPSAPEAKSSGSLLERYNVGDDPADAVTKGWQESREQREAQLKAQRRAMVQQARQKLMQENAPS